MPPAGDAVRPGAATPVAIVVDGERVSGILGQTIAGIIMAQDVLRLRDSREARPRGVFCGIGVCFDCLVTVNGVSDVRACQRAAVEGDEVLTGVDAPMGFVGEDATSVGRGRSEQGDVES
jgi:hypothetical protein